MEPVVAHPGTEEGRPETVKLCVADRRKALVTVTVTVGTRPCRTVEGAVQVTRLVEAVLCAVPSVPVLAVQENLSPEPWGSEASARKESCCPGVALSEEGSERTISGGE
jgi:hypothetical protein